MASPQLQQVIDSIKALAGMASGSSIEQLRATNEADGAAHATRRGK